LPTEPPADLDRQLGLADGGRADDRQKPAGQERRNSRRRRPPSISSIVGRPCGQVMAGSVVSRSRRRDSISSRLNRRPTRIAASGPPPEPGSGGGAPAPEAAASRVLGLRRPEGG